MTKIYLLTNIVIVSAVIVICAISECNGVISDKRLCYDPECREPVSLARTLIRYNSIEPHILSFPSNTEIIIFSKEAGKRQDLWGAQVHGKRGYVPKALVREYKTIKSKLEYEVPTEHIGKEVNTTDALKTGVPTEKPDPPRGIEKTDTEVNSTSDESQNPSEIRNVENGVNNTITNELKTSKAPEKLTGNSDSAIDTSNAHQKDSIPPKSEKILEGVQSITPSYEIIDGTAIPVLNDEVPIKPSHSTPIIVATVSPDEEPSLSVHPSLPSTTLPLISRFSNSNSQPMVKDQKSDSHLLAENQSRETDLKKQSSPVQDHADDSKIHKSGIGEKVHVEDDSKIEARADNNISVDTKTSEIAEQTKNGRDNHELEVKNSEYQPIHDTKTLENAERPKNIKENDEAKIKDVVYQSIPDTKTSENAEQSENKQENHESRVRNVEHQPIHDTKISENAKLTTNGKEDYQPQINNLKSDEKPSNLEIDKNNKVEWSANPHVSVDTTKIEDGFHPTVEAAGSTINYTQKDERNAVNNMTNELEKENVILGTNESSGVDLQKNSNNNGIFEAESKFDNNTAEIVQKEHGLERTIQRKEFQDSRKQTQYLSDEKIADTTKIVAGSDNIGNGKNETPLSNQVVEQYNNQVILNDGITDHNENITVHDVDNVHVETEIVDDLENVSREGITENKYALYGFNPSSEEIATDLHSNLEEKKLTTAKNLQTVADGLHSDDDELSREAFDTREPDGFETQSSQEYENETYNRVDVHVEAPEFETVKEFPETALLIKDSGIAVAPSEVCDIDSDCATLDNNETSPNEEPGAEAEERKDNEGSYLSFFEEHNYLETLLYLSITALTTLLFSLGYYYIENLRRDKELVAKINILEKELLVTTKESMMLNEGLKATKHKLDSIEDESFGSNEMVVSLKSELEAAQITKEELEDQILTLEKELESATEAGLELERMLREFLASQSDENPLAQSVEDLQTRLNAQQAANESLTNNLNLKSQENEALTTELSFTQERCQQLEVEVTRLSGELKVQSNLKNNAEKEFSAKIAHLNKQMSKLSEERTGLITELTTKEMALNELSEVMKQQNADTFNFEKLYNVYQIKAEAHLVTKERDELKLKLTEVEGAHQLLEEHMKLIKEEIASITEQYELAERDKTEAQTRLEVLSNYFKEKESQLQKELGMQEAMWVQKQGEVTSTVERIQTMQNEIQNYRQQIETLKREILDQEREYKSQIAALDTKSHEQWVIARQSERRLEESKAEASQLRNRLTMVEKSINEVDSDSKIHRLETNGETASSPQLFMGAETSSSPILFTGSSGVPPLPPSYMYGAPLPPPFIPPLPHSGGGPMYDISRRPPPLGGRLSSPPPIPPLPHPSGRYEDTSSPPPPLSPPLHSPYNHRSPPPFSNERIHHPHPPPPFLPPLGTSHSWGDEPLPPLRNPVFHPHQREQRVRNHKGSLHSSGDSLDKTNHTGKA